LPARQQTDTGVAEGTTADSQVIVAGFGRVGRIAANMLRENGYRTAIIDHNPDRFAELRAEGFVGFYGDALRPDLLEAAGAAQAAIIVIAIDNYDGAVDLLKRVKREYPHLQILARAPNSVDLRGLLAAGADRSYAETFETALLMGEDALELAGMSPLDAQAFSERYRDAIVELDHHTDEKTA